MAAAGNWLWIGSSQNIRLVGRIRERLPWFQSRGSSSLARATRIAAPSNDDFSLALAS